MSETRPAPGERWRNKHTGESVRIVEIYAPKGVEVVCYEAKGEVESWPLDHPNWGPPWTDCWERVDTDA